MKVVYFGTPIFAAEVLQYLLEQNIHIVAVVTQPDRPQGRSSTPVPSRVKQLLFEKAPHIPILQPEKASQENFLQELASFQADLFVVVAFGQILPQKLLNMPPLGCINVHASLLPKYRGAAPMQRCLMAGDAETGISIQKMVYQLDAGDVIRISKTPISEDMTLGELATKLISLTKPLLTEVIHEYEKKIPSAIPQDPKQISFASKIEPEEREVHWDMPARMIHNQIRALSPLPGAWCWFTANHETKRLKILSSRIVSGHGEPGQFLENHIVCCKENALQLLEVQPEGKRRMNAADWFRDKKILFHI